MSLMHFLRVAQVKIDTGGTPELNQLPRGVNQNNITTGLRVAFGVAGGLALVVIVYGGLKYVLSQGNPQETNKAKNTIIDGLLGLAIIATAGGIVAFVVVALT
jgi:hypothetical protein